MEHNMLTWNWPNWITVVLMVAVGYLALSLVGRLVRGRMTTQGGGPTTGAGAGPSQSQKNFAGVYGASMFAMPAPAS